MATTSALAKLKTRANAADNGEARELQIPLDKLVFDPDQPRKEFTESSLQEMAESLKEHGQIQAITVQDNGDDTYTIVVGERRTRGSQLLGLPTVRAKVRNDLTNRSKRLLFQLTENVQREDLTERELANSILELMRDIPGVQEPMSQRAIANSMGKSEGWVSRFVKFSDEALQKKWVQTGILDTVEKVYRVTLLPEQAQAEIVRRTALPEGAPERLETPLARSVIEDFARDVKISKIAKSVVVVEEIAATTGLAQADHATAGTTQDNVGATLAGLVKEGHAGSKQTSTPNAPAKDTTRTQSSGQYQLPAAAREKILEGASTAPVKAQAPTETAVAPSVHCKVEAAGIVALMNLLAKSNKDVRKAASSLQYSVVIPGPLAQVIAHAMTGKKQSPGDVAATVQRELAKLG